MADRSAILERAAELDDDQPDDVCPGCGQDITGWERFEAHYLPDVRLARDGARWRALATERLPMPFTTIRSAKAGALCEWDGDMLAARQHRRLLLAGVR